MGNRILIADDDPLMRVLVAVSLADFAEIVEAADGREALNLLRTSHFDLLLLDWDMPDHDGLEVLRIFRTWGNITPAMLVTAKSERADVVNAIRAGASDYIVKPFETQTLRQKVLNLLPRTPGSSIAAAAPQEAHSA
jgi:two-component system, chemotaxis family, chemotaxis protein CheY